MRRNVLGIAIALIVAQPSVQAARLDYAVEMGVEHSDNIRLVRTDKTSDTLFAPRVSASFTEAGSVVQADVSGALEYIHYVDDSYDNETRAQLDANVNWVMIPDRLSWTFVDKLGVEPIRLRDPTAPDNVQQVNVFATGPTLYLSHSSTLNSLFELRYVDSYAEVADEFDSQRVLGAYRIRRQTSALGTLSFNIEAQDIRFNDNTFALDNSSQAAYIGYARTLKDVEVQAAAGYSRIEFDNGESVSGPLARVSAEWTATPRNRFRGQANWQYSDMVGDILLGTNTTRPGVGGIGIGGSNITGDAYREKSGILEHVFEDDRLTLTTGVHGGTFRHVNSLVTSIDRNEFGGHVGVRYRLTPLISIGCQAAAGKTEYVETDDSDRYRLYGAYVEHQVMRNWSWRLDLARRTQDTPDDNETRSYRENRVMFRIIYRR